MKKKLLHSPLDSLAINGFGFNNTSDGFLIFHSTSIA